jgi:hypothetical protein
MERAQFYQKQMQQNTQNPIIGRALATDPFRQQQAPALMGGSGSGNGMEALG